MSSLSPGALRNRFGRGKPETTADKSIISVPNQYCAVIQSFQNLNIWCMTINRYRNFGCGPVGTHHLAVIPNSFCLTGQNCWLGEINKASETVSALDCNWHHAEALSQLLNICADSTSCCVWAKALLDVFSSAPVTRLRLGPVNIPSSLWNFTNKLDSYTTYLHSAGPALGTLPWRRQHPSLFWNLFCCTTRARTRDCHCL